MTVTSAMILAAGLGTRMRPITDTRPKPLVEVSGKPLIAYALESLAAAGIGHVVVNVHYLAAMLIDWLDQWSGADIQISDETQALLDSGGGVAKALPLLGQSPFVVLNADTFWIDDPGFPRGNLARMVDLFDPETMDILMMTARPDQATGHTGGGDFAADADGRLHRYKGEGAPLIYAGALILHPRILNGIAETAFSLNRCFDAAIAAGRLYGFAMRGHWITVGTPGAIGEAEAARAAYIAAHDFDSGDTVR